MIVTYRHPIKELLKEIEVSDSDYDKAINRYESISQFVANSDLGAFNPEIFVQGSFKLGTATKPITEDGSYDVDIVLELRNIKRTEITQKKLKEIVGKVIVDYARSNNMSNIPKDGKRCWTIEYVDNHNFHVDILPTVIYENDNLAYTNKKNQHYNQISDKWDVTNPKGYFEWFAHKSNYSKYAEKFAKEIKMSVEKIPTYRVKTDLQRVIQVFKRHAEVMFSDRIEYKPSSVIITTLCAKAYSKINDFEISFEDLLRRISLSMLSELDCVYGKYCVLNPVNPNENLSSKWDNPKYFREFEKWVEQLKFDLSAESRLGKTEEEFNLLKRSLNKSSTSTALQNNVELLPYHQKMKWNNKIWKDVIIKAYICDGNKKKIKNILSGEEIGKNTQLRFEVETTYLNLYEVYWQITNTGYEAQKALQLRGDFYDSEPEIGGKIRFESTSYTGKHFVEAFVVDKEGNCVGRSYPFVVNVG